MRYAQMRSMDISNGTGVGVALFVQGCHFHCKDCFNSETWDFDGGKLFTIDELNVLIDLAGRPYISRISILGGEPLADENYDDIVFTVRRIIGEYPNKKVWLYSGYTFDEILADESKREILQYIDVMVDGRYVAELKDMSYQFAGSTNQRVIDVQKSLRMNEVCLWENK